MINRIKLILPFLILAISANAQISISNVKDIEKVKGTTTYITMNDPNDAVSLKYAEIFKKYWTFSKIEFIKYADINKYLNANSSFLNLGGYTTNVESYKLYSNGSRNLGIKWENTHLYLELWTCSEKFLKKKGDSSKEFKEKDKNQIARLELYTDFQTLRTPENLFLTNFGCENHIRNWGEGLLKNHLQNMIMYLEMGKEKSLYSPIINDSEIKKLQNKTLYIPDYAFTKFNAFTGDESKKHDEKELLEDYKPKYQVISTKELNEKILKNEEPFFYLQYIKSSTDKYVSVINSQTGEVVYSSYSPASYNLKSGDLKDLSKKISKQ
ncbi:hypothetical protein [Flavobacterium psychrophilum]|uniref:hypothetical protein n=1 Tax=Flavobacterium psychrophilum TaxID=96345 RepID=UPI000A360CDD|nr:hypothetical protein [Flavobacterium psychrophilum]OUD26122.1 hypothetical protein FPG92_10960 [Flavobacterium psychrophilum]